MFIVIFYGVLCARVPPLVLCRVSGKRYIVVGLSLRVAAQYFARTLVYFVFVQRELVGRVWCACRVYDNSL